MSVRIFLARHGETEWSAAGRHTGRTDLPLTPTGEDQARALGRRLSSHVFVSVLTSPARRARQTCDRAGYAGRAVVVDDLREWDYGDYEGRTTADIQQEAHAWDLWHDGAPGGEGPEQVATRAERVIGEAVAGRDGDVLVFGHGHMSRMLGARWVGADPGFGTVLRLSTASLSLLGWEHGHRAIELWNDICHLEGRG